MFLLFLLSQAGHHVSQGPPEQTPICVSGQGPANPGPSGCNHAVVCVNILHSQLWARGGWERVVYSFCHGKRQLKKERSLHPADRPEATPLEGCPSGPLGCASVAKYHQTRCDAGWTWPQWPQSSRHALKSWALAYQCSWSWHLILKFQSRKSPVSLSPARSLLRWWERNTESAAYLGDWDPAWEHGIWGACR